MCADIYRTGKCNVFVIVPKGAGLGMIPPNTFSDLGHPTLLGTRNLADDGLGSICAAVAAELSERGFAVTKF